MNVIELNKALNEIIDTNYGADQCHESTMRIAAEALTNVLEIDKIYSEKCREVAELKKQLEANREGDLISRKALERAIRDYADEVGCNRGEYELANGILKSLSVVKNQPTAYDVDKVIEELKKNTFCAECYDEAARFDGEVFDCLLFLDDVHKIVKAGGADEKR